MWTLTEVYKGKLALCLNFTNKLAAGKYFYEYLTHQGASLSESQLKRLSFKHDYGIMKVVKNDPIR